ncbi:hypothetical protein LX32DRAFT_340528 [Colletotrichum zoysiae]|uniref:Uncharacterized protein n=1 Tax=Colletotrichum zoysiae TaxID=1216348 RepID=A0AAD9HV32_9PEZI|nr:hypothetical protein LX32DRAFT_340528 [Colletotrichum zoysiae]
MVPRLERAGICGNRLRGRNRVGESGERRAYPSPGLVVSCRGLPLMQLRARGSGRTSVSLSLSLSLAIPAELFGLQPPARISSTWESRVTMLRALLRLCILPPPSSPCQKGKRDNVSWHAKDCSRGGAVVARVIWCVTASIPDSPSLARTGQDSRQHTSRSRGLPSPPLPSSEVRPREPSRRVPAKVVGNLVPSRLRVPTGSCPYLVTPPRRPTGLARGPWTRSYATNGFEPSLYLPLSREEQIDARELAYSVKKLGAVSTGRSASNPLHRPVEPWCTVGTRPSNESKIEFLSVACPRDGTSETAPKAANKLTGLLQQSKATRRLPGRAAKLRADASARLTMLRASGEAGWVQNS